MDWNATFLSLKERNPDQEVKSGKSSKRKRQDVIVTEVKLEEELKDERGVIEEIRERAVKRQKIIHETFIEPRITMREGMIRVLEGNIGTKLLKEENIDESESEMSAKEDE